MRPDEEFSLFTAHQVYQEICRYVDMWAMPEIHPTNVSLLQNLKATDSQQFTKHLYAVRTVTSFHQDSRRWQKTHPARISYILLLRGGQGFCWQRQPAPIDPHRMTIRFRSNAASSLPAR